MGKEYCDIPGPVSYNRRVYWGNLQRDFRTFDGKRYVFLHNFTNQRYANMYAKKWRNDGWLARVTHDGTFSNGNPSYTVWVSKPKEHKFTKV